MESGSPEESKQDSKSSNEPFPVEPVEATQHLEHTHQELRAYLESVNGELATLRTSVDARRRENTILKIMLYTGVILLMLAFFYSSQATQQAQLKSLELNLDHMQTLQDGNLGFVQRSMFLEFNKLKMRVEKLEKGTGTVWQNEQKLGLALMGMNSAITPFKEDSPYMSQLVDQIHKESDRLFSNYQQFAENNSPIR